MKRKIFVTSVYLNLEQRLSPCRCIVTKATIILYLVSLEWPPAAPERICLIIKPATSTFQQNDDNVSLLLPTTRTRPKQHRRRVVQQELAGIVLLIAVQPVQFLSGKGVVRMCGGWWSWYSERTLLVRIKMLVKTEGGNPSGRQNPGKPPGILDSPTLARVERAMLRHEEGSHRDGAHLHRAAYTQVRKLFQIF